MNNKIKKKMGVLWRELDSGKQLGFCVPGSLYKDLYKCIPFLFSLREEL
jgi:hypothetical protein